MGASVTFTATVTGGSGANAPTGTVTFGKDGTTTLSTGTLIASGMATYATSALAAGSHSVTANYAGDTNNAASVSSSVAVAVWPGPPNFTMALSPGSGSFKAGTPAAITVTVTSVNGFNAATTLTCSGLPKNTTCIFFAEYHANRLQNGNINTHHCNGRKGNLRHSRIGELTVGSPVAFTTSDYECRRSGGTLVLPSPRRQESEAPETFC